MSDITDTAVEENQSNFERAQHLYDICDMMKTFLTFMTKPHPGIHSSYNYNFFKFLDSKKIYAKCGCKKPPPTNFSIYKAFAMILQWCSKTCTKYDLSNIIFMRDFFTFKV